MEKGFQIAQTSIRPKPASTSRPPKPPSPLLTMLPDVFAQASTLLSNRSISSLSRSPAETSFLLGGERRARPAEDVRDVGGHRVEPGPARRARPCR